MDFSFTQDQRQLIERVNQLVKERIAPRAAQYDTAFEAPVEDIRDLYDQGWLLANLGKRRGGLGFGLYGDDPLAFFLIDGTWPTAIPRRPIVFKCTTTR